MGKKIIFLLITCLIGCNLEKYRDHNSNRYLWVEHFEKGMFRPNGYFSETAVDWDMQIASYRKATGEWGGNIVPDTAYGIDSTGTILIFAGLNCGVGFDRLRDNGKLYWSNAKKRGKKNESIYYKI